MNFEMMSHNGRRMLAKRCGLKNNRTDNLLLRDLCLIKKDKLYEIPLSCWIDARLEESSLPTEGTTFNIFLLI
jgi:hypothetical protein